MLDETPTRKTQGTVAVLALLLGVLFSSVTTPAARAADSRSAATGLFDAAKPAAKLRATARTQAEEADEFFSDGSAPEVETTIVASRPAIENEIEIHSAEPTDGASAYRARAPPAS